MHYRETTPPIERAYLKAFIAFILGSMSVVLAITLAQYGFKAVFAVSFILAGVVFFAYFSSEQGIARWALLFLGLGIPFNLDVNLFYRAYVGVTSVDIGVTLLCAFILYVIFWYQHGRAASGPLFRYDKYLLWAPILYMMAGCLSFYNASSLELVVLELVRLTMLFLIFFIIMNLKGKEQISTFIFSLALGLILESAIAFYQFRTGQALGLTVLGERLAPVYWSFLTRAGGTIGHPNVMAYYFEMLIPFTFAMFLVEERAFLKLFYLIAAVAGMVGIITTMSRGAWITLPLSLPLVFFVVYAKKLAQPRAYAYLIPGLFLVTLTFLLVVVPAIRSRLTFEDVSARSRRPLNTAAFSIVRQFPITGVGLNNFARVFRTYDTTGGSSVFKDEGDVQHVVHNLYLWVWCETGTIGLITFCGLFLSSFFVGLKCLVRAGPWERAVVIGAIAGMAAHAIHGFVDPGFRMLMSTSMLFYSLMGIIGAISISYASDDEGPGS